MHHIIEPIYRLALLGDLRESLGLAETGSLCQWLELGGHLRWVPQQDLCCYKKYVWPSGAASSQLVL